MLLSLTVMTFVKGTHKNVHDPSLQWRSDSQVGVMITSWRKCVRASQPWLTRSQTLMTFGETETGTIGNGSSTLLGMEL